MPDNFSKKNYIYDLLAIDRNGESEIKTGKKLALGLMFSETLLKDANHTEEPSIHRIKTSDGIEMNIQTLDAGGAVSGHIESVFRIRCSCQSFTTMEPFRAKLLEHLKNRLNFSNIVVNKDDVSMELSSKIYPITSAAESSLRSYLGMFFIQKIGMDWFEQLKRKTTWKSSDTLFSRYVDSEVLNITFEELGGLIYRPSMIKEDLMYKKMIYASSPDEVIKIHREMMGNYAGFLKESFLDKDFESKWKSLSEIRNKVAHTGMFSAKDMTKAINLGEEIESIIHDAEKHISDFKFSLYEQQAMLQESIAEYKEQREITVAQPQAVLVPSTYAEPIAGVKVIDKIELPKERKRTTLKPNFEKVHVDYEDDVIDDEKVILELDKAIYWAKTHGRSFVGLKFFVTKWLADNGYGIPPSYGVINLMKSKGIIEITDETVDDNLVAAIKFITPMHEEVKRILKHVKRH